MAQQPPTLKNVNLYTWNTQGNFTTGQKGQELSAMITGNDPALVFVQEGGVNLAGPYNESTAVAGYAVGAFNERCTNYIVFNNQWPMGGMQSVVLVNGSNMALIGGGVAGRTPAAIDLGRTLFVSWHSLSSPNNLDTSDLLRTLTRTPSYAEKYDLIIIGGDFNASPGDIESMMVRMVTDRSDPYFFSTIVKCGQPTLKQWDKEVDFFIYLRKEYQQEIPAALRQTQSSDHEAVQTQVAMML
jgi:hypothetical protein